MRDEIIRAILDSNTDDELKQFVHFETFDFDTVYKLFNDQYETDQLRSILKKGKVS